MYITEFSGFLLVLSLVLMLALDFVDTSNKNIEALQKMKRQQQMLSNIAHDLKSPVSAITGYLELLDGDIPLDETRKTYFFNQIKISSNAMLHRIKNLQLIADFIELNTKGEKI